MTNLLVFLADHAIFKVRLVFHPPLKKGVGVKKNQRSINWVKKEQEGTCCFVSCLSSELPAKIIRLRYESLATRDSAFPRLCSY